MSYSATVYKVMIASPSDVGPERLIARDCVHEWNDLHAEDRAVVLLPVGWESHANPSMANRAQEVINEQVLSGCDLLIGIFWTRLGTPTGKAASGSVEEIDRHLAAGGHAMLYFSDAPVEPSSIDSEQYARLREFRDQCQERGLIDVFITREEFREKLRRHLVQVSLREFTAPNGANGTGLKDITEEDYRIPQPSLSREAKILLYHASQDKHAVIARHRYFGGSVVQANGKSWPAEQSARAKELWWGAVEELYTEGLVRMRGVKGEVFELTREGFAVADQLGPQPDA